MCSCSGAAGRGKVISGVSASEAVVWRCAASFSRARHCEGQVDAKLAQEVVNGSVMLDRDRRYASEVQRGVEGEGPGATLCQQ